LPGSLTFFAIRSELRVPLSIATADGWKAQVPMLESFSAWTPCAGGHTRSGANSRNPNPGPFFGGPQNSSNAAISDCLSSETRLGLCSRRRRAPRSGESGLLSGGYGKEEIWKRQSAYCHDARVFQTHQTLLEHAGGESRRAPVCHCFGCRLNRSTLRRDCVCDARFTNALLLPTRP